MTRGFYQKPLIHPDTKQLLGCAAAKVGPSMAATMGKHFVWIGRSKSLRERFQSFNQQGKSHQIKQHFSVESAMSQQRSRDEVCILPPRWLGNKGGFISVLTYCSLMHKGRTPPYVIKLITHKYA